MFPHSSPSRRARNRRRILKHRLVGSIRILIVACGAPLRRDSAKDSILHGALCDHLEEPEHDAVDHKSSTSMASLGEDQPDPGPGCEAFGVPSRKPRLESETISDLGYQRLEKLLTVLPKCGLYMVNGVAPCASQGRQRTLLPLPRLQHLPDMEGLPSSRSLRKVLLDFVNAEICVLNGMYTGRLWKPCCYNRPLSCAQMCAVKRLICTVMRLASRLSLCDLIQERPVDHKSAYPRLQADRVDMLLKAGAVDPMPHLPEDIRDLLCKRSFFDPERGLAYQPPKFYAGKRCEYAKLVSDQLRSGKKRLRASISGAGDIFVVDKAGGMRQREVWHGRVVSSWAQIPPRPRHLPTPADLLDLEGSFDFPLIVSKRDCRCWFDQLCLPSSMQKWMGQPSLTARELSRHGGLSIADVNSFVDDCEGVPVMPGTVLYPVSAVWSMGFAWSPYIAQETLLSVSRSAGFEESLFLSSDSPAPMDLSPAGQACALATDDFMHFCRDPKLALVAMDSYDSALAAAGAQKHEQKDVTAAENATTIGIDITDGLWLDPHAPRLCRQWDLLCLMLNDGKAAPEEVQFHMGVLQWLDLLQRGKLAVYSAVYSWMRDDMSDVPKKIPQQVMQELAVSLLLAGAWSFNLSKPYACMIGASDASEEYGFGGSVYHCTQDEARNVARLSERRGDYVRLQKDPDVIEYARIGHPHRLDIAMEAFQDVISVRKKRPDHPGVLELNAVVMFVEWFLRSSDHQCCRLPLLIDAKAVLGAVVKGRSSSGPFLRLLRKLASLLILGDITLRCVYVPSEDNPSDGASRGRRRRPPIRKLGKVRKPSKCEHRLQKNIFKLESALRRLRQTGMLSSGTTSSISSSCSSVLLDNLAF